MDLFHRNNVRSIARKNNPERCSGCFLFSNVFGGDKFVGFDCVNNREIFVRVFFVIVCGYDNPEVVLFGNKGVAIFEVVLLIFANWLE